MKFHHVLKICSHLNLILHTLQLFTHLSATNLSWTTFDVSLQKTKFLILHYSKFVLLLIRLNWTIFDSMVSSTLIYFYQIRFVFIYEPNYDSTLVVFYSNKPTNSQLYYVNMDYQMIPYSLVQFNLSTDLRFLSFFDFIN